MRLFRLQAWFSLCALCLLGLLAGCSAPLLTQQESYVFGTRVEVLVYGTPKGDAEKAISEVLREFDRLHRTYHAWQPSELTALNDAIAAGHSVNVSTEMVALLKDAQAFSAAGGHLFDPGVGKLIGLWGFQSDEFKAQLPDAAALAAWREKHPSIADLQVTGDVVTSRNTAVAIDFGGYLKGVALDRAAAILKAHGIHDALINIGGNVMALGSKGKEPWRVGIQHPRPDTNGGAPLAMLELHDGEAIGTSGDYQRYFELDGKRYCHLLDPRTAAPAVGTQAITVLIPPQQKTGFAVGMLSDAASKPLFISGNDWTHMAEQLGLRYALRVAANGQVEMTPAMRERIQIQESHK